MAPNPEKGLAIACNDLQIQQRYVVYPGTERIPLRHRAQAIGLAGIDVALGPAQPKPRLLSGMVRHSRGCKNFCANGQLL
ncbi:MAG: hypothetical protein RLZZ401_1100 [Pseudomonadota bacterium]